MMQRHSPCARYRYGQNAFTKKPHRPDFYCVKVFTPYLQESSLCVWETRSPIPVCGGWRKSSEAERSTANHAVYKSPVWMAGSSTDEKEKGEEEEWKGVRYSTSESAAAWGTFRHGNKYPSHPPFVSLFHTHPPPSSLSPLQNALWLPWATLVMSGADAHTPLSTPDYTNRARRWGGASPPSPLR